MVRFGLVCIMASMQASLGLDAPVEVVNLKEVEDMNKVVSKETGMPLCIACNKWLCDVRVCLRQCAHHYRIGFRWCVCGQTYRTRSFCYRM